MYVLNSQFYQILFVQPVIDIFTKAHNRGTSLALDVYVVNNNKKEYLAFHCPHDPNKQKSVKIFIHFLIGHMDWYVHSGKPEIKERESKSSNPLRQPHNTQ